MSEIAIFTTIFEQVGRFPRVKAFGAAVVLPVGALLAVKQAWPPFFDDGQATLCLLILLWLVAVGAIVNIPGSSGRKMLNAVAYSMAAIPLVLVLLLAASDCPAGYTSRTCRAVRQVNRDPNVTERECSEAGGQWVRTGNRENVAPHRYGGRCALLMR